MIFSPIYNILRPRISGLLLQDNKDNKIYSQEKKEKKHGASRKLNKPVKWSSAGLQIDFAEDPSNPKSELSF